MSTLSGSPKDFDWHGYLEKATTRPRPDMNALLKQFQDDTRKTLHNFDYQSFFGIAKFIDWVNNLDDSIFPNPLETALHHSQLSHLLDPLTAAEIPFEDLLSESYTLQGLAEECHISENDASQLLPRQLANQDPITQSTIANIQLQLAKAQRDDGCGLKVDKFPIKSTIKPFDLLSNHVFQDPNKLKQCFENSEAKDFSDVLMKRIKGVLTKYCVYCYKFTKNDTVCSSCGCPLRAKDDADAKTAAQRAQNLAAQRAKIFKSIIFKKGCLENLVQITQQTLADNLQIGKEASPLVSILVDFARRGESFDRVVDDSRVQKNSDHPWLEGLNSKTLLICLLEAVKEEQLPTLVALCEKAALPYPFIYYHYLESGPKLKVNHKYFLHSYAKEYPVVVCCGTPRCGKSNLLNLLFKTKFETDETPNVFHTNSVDFMPSTSNFSIPIHLVDIHGGIIDPLYGESLSCVLTLFPRCFVMFNVWAVEITNPDRLLAIYSELATMTEKHPRIKLLIIVRDADLKKTSRQDLEKAFEEPKIKPFISLIFPMPKVDGSGSTATNVGDLLKEILAHIGIDKHLKDGSKCIVPLLEDAIKTEAPQTFSLATFTTQEKEMLLATKKQFDDLPMENTICLTLFPQSAISQQIYQRTQEFKANVEKDPSSRFKLQEDLKADIKSLQESRQGKKISPIVADFLNLHKGVGFPQKARSFSVMFERWFQQKLNTLVAPLQIQLEQAKARAKGNKTGEQEIAKLTDDILKLSASMDNFSRETVALFLEDKIEGGLRDPLVTSYTDWLLSGGAVELINGDLLEIPDNLLTKVFEKLQKSSPNRCKNPFVVAVVGKQSSGKSTLMNFLFGCHFVTSSGRCTKGLYISLLETTFPEVPNVLVLDSEGLLSVEREHTPFDNNIMMALLASSNVLLINVSKEIGTDLTQMFTVCAFGLNQLKNSSIIFPKIIFILRDNDDMDKSKFSTALEKFNKDLKEVLSGGLELEFTQENLMPMYCAYSMKVNEVKLGENQASVEFFKERKVSEAFSKNVEDLRKQVLTKDQKSNNFDTIQSWYGQLKNAWSLVSQHGANWAYMKSMKDDTDQKKLGEEFDQWKKDTTPKCDTVAKNYLIEFQNSIKTKQTETDLAKAKENYSTSIGTIKEDYLIELKKKIDEVVKSNGPTKEVLEEINIAIDHWGKFFIHEWETNAEVSLDDRKAQIEIEKVLSSLANWEKFRALGSDSQTLKKYFDKGWNETVSIFETNIILRKEEEAKKAQDLAQKTFVMLNSATPPSRRLYNPHNLDQASNVFQRDFRKQPITDGEIRSLVKLAYPEGGRKFPLHDDPQKLQKIIEDAKKPFESWLVDQNFDMQVFSATTNQAILALNERFFPATTNQARNERSQPSISEALLTNQLSPELELRLSAFQWLQVCVTNLLQKKYYQARSDKQISDLRQKKTETFKKLQASFEKYKSIDDAAHRFVESVLSAVKQEWQKDFDMVWQTELSTHVTTLQPKHLADMCDEVIWNLDSPKDTEQVFSYINDPQPFMTQIFDEHFRKEVEKRYITTRNNHQTILEGHIKALKYRIHQWSSIISSIMTASSKELDLYPILINYLKGHWEKAAEALQKHIGLSDSKITALPDPRIFGFGTLGRSFEVTVESSNIIQNYFDQYSTNQQFVSSCSLPTFSMGEKNIQNRRTIELQQALGCNAKCPYCKAKCTSSGNHSKHETDRHRIMAFGGCKKPCETPGKESKLEFVFDCCNLPSNFNNSKWPRKRNDSKLSDKTLTRLSDKSALSDAKVQVGLRWEDYNDLDLIVVCPCKTRIGASQSDGHHCPTCGGRLNLDANLCARGPSQGGILDPAEHVIFGESGKAPRVGNYEVRINFFRGYDGSTSSAYSVEVQNDTQPTCDGGNWNQKPKTGTISTSQQLITIGQFEVVSDGVNFLNHLKENFDDWTISCLSDQEERSQTIFKWLELQNRFWVVLRKKFLQLNADLIDNTPEEFWKQLEKTCCCICFRNLNTAQTRCQNNCKNKHFAHSQCQKQKPNFCVFPNCD